MTRAGRLAFAALALCWAGAAFAHGVAESDQSYIRAQQGPHFWLFFYLGAKHMVTGTDHLLFLLGVIFFLHRIRDVATYVTLFAVGHSLTLLAGVLLQTNVSSSLVDAVIGLSVVYKALENIGAVKRWLPFSINPKYAVLGFGLFHGLGLATKVQAMGLSENGLVPNLLAFNLGVEAGQLLALSAMLIGIMCWRRTASFSRHAFVANVAIMGAGFVLIGMHLIGYFSGVSA